MSPSWRLVALIVVGSVIAGAMTGSLMSTSAAASYQARGSTGRPDCGVGVVLPWPRRDVGRIVAKAEMYCSDEAPQFPYMQIRLKLQYKKPGTDGWVTKSF